MKNFIIFATLFFSTAAFIACNKQSRVIRTDTETSGVGKMGGDESFKPIIEEELAVFTGLNPEATVEPVYTNEPELFKMLLEDSIRLIVAARDLTDYERQALKEIKKQPRTQRVAIDGIAFIINRQNRDSLITTGELRKIMNGTITQWNEIGTAKNSRLGEIKVVFDNPNSSTLRFINDSICKGDSISERIRALQNNSEVLEYVAKTPNALGVIGINWISNPNDPNKLTFRETIRVMALSREDVATDDDSFQPVPAWLATRQYPLVRDLYLILTDVRGGLPAGVVKFFAGESGQRIVLKAGLVPATAPTRLINMKEN